MAESDSHNAALAQECAAWSDYLVGRAPSAALLARYVDAHTQGVVDAQGSISRFDRALVRVARSGSGLARAADVHARVFRPAGLLRRKLVLTLALLEVDRESHARVDTLSAHSRAGLALSVLYWCLRFGLLLILGALLFVPLRLICALFGTPTEAA